MLVKMTLLVVRLLMGEIGKLKLGDELAVEVNVIMYVEVTWLVTVVATLLVGHGHSSVHGSVDVELLIDGVTGDEG